MKKTNILVLIICALFLFGCGQESLQRSNPLDPLYSGNGTISGTFTLLGQPVAGAFIYTNPVTKTATTDSTGRYTLSIAPGTYTIFAQAPWYAAVSLAQQTITSGSTANGNFLPPSLTPNYQSPCNPEGFELYSPLSQPQTPWNCINSGGSASATVVATMSASGTKSCRLECGTLAGNNTKIQLFNLAATRGVRVSGKINTDNLNCKIKFGVVSDSGSKTTEFGLDSLAAPGYVRYKLPTGVTGDPTVSTALAVNNWYYFYFELDYETKTASFEVWNQSKSMQYSTTGPLTFIGTFGTIDLFYITNTNNTPAINTIAFVDDIIIIKK